ncbi:MAG: hypothetical protein H0V44_02975 [Planctomycetes bacterium]|nr:hypothetical protein [Planctomycetota bacterium]
MDAHRDAHPNPFTATDANRRDIWDILMRRDFTAFIANDWAITAPDFVPAGEFLGIDAGKVADASRWTIAYPTLTDYRDEWLRQAAAFVHVALVGEEKLAFFYRAVRIERIDLVGERALANKVFAGSARCADGSTIDLRWRTLYHLRRLGGAWKIAGFVGYLPEPMIPVRG